MQLDWFPFWLSLRVAGIATVLSVVGGFGLAYLLATRKFRGKALVEAAVLLPLVLPPTVIGYYLLVVIGRETPLGTIYEAIFGGPLLFTWQAAVLAAALYALPLLVRSARDSLEAVDPAGLRTARSLGAGEWRTLWQVALPQMRGPLAAATVVAFARAFGEFGATLMIAGYLPGQTATVATAVYAAVESGDGALARGLVIATSILALMAVWAAGRFAPPRSA